MTSIGLDFINLISNNMNIMDANWFIDGVRNFFLIIDTFLFYLVTVFYNLIYDLANLKIFNSSDFGEITQRVYSLLAIFMLFRVSFSLITYVISPDQFSDKTAGMQNIAKNIVIAFLLIIISPWLFSQLQKIQTAILDENVIPQFVLGTGGDEMQSSVIMSDRCCEKGENSDGSCVDDSYLKIKTKSAADFIAFIAFKPFFQIDDTTTSDEIKNVLRDGYCSIYGQSGDTVTIGEYLSTNNIDVVNKTNSLKKYMINYVILFPTITGVALTLILISFCFDIAVRSFTIMFLQIFAPIPIISFINPKSAKDGMFRKYVKTYSRVWLSLFIRIAAFSFAIFFIQLIASTGINPVGEMEPKTNRMWIYLFAVIGALMFAKKFPKLIEEVTGFKLDGAFKLSPLNRIKEEALGGKVVAKLPGAAAALGIGAAGGLIAGGAVNSEHLANAIKNKDLKAGLKGAGGMLSGGVSGFFRGGAGGLTEGYKAKSVSGSLKAGADTVTKVGKKLEAYQGTTKFERAGERLSNLVTGKSTADRLEEGAKAYKEFNDTQKLLMERAQKELVKDTSFKTKFKDASTGNMITGNVNMMKYRLDQLKQAGGDPETIARLESYYNQAWKQAQTDYVSHGGIWDESSKKTKTNDSDIVNSYVDKLSRISSENKSLPGFMPDLRSGDIGENLKNVSKAIEKYDVNLQTGKELAHAKEVRDAVKKATK